MQHTIQHLEDHELVLVKVHTDSGDLLFEGVTDVSDWVADAIDEMIEMLTLTDTGKLVYDQEAGERFFSTRRLYH